jgi:hypothetical protein
MSMLRREVDQAGHRLAVCNGYHQPHGVATAAGAQVLDVSWNDLEAPPA